MYKFLEPGHIRFTRDPEMLGSAPSSSPDLSPADCITYVHGSEGDEAIFHIKPTSAMAHNHTRVTWYSTYYVDCIDVTEVASLNAIDVGPG